MKQKDALYVFLYSDGNPHTWENGFMLRWGPCNLLDVSEEGRDSIH